MGSLFSKNDTPSAKDSVVNINAGGLSSSLKKNTISLSSSADRKALVGNIAKTFPEQASFFSDMAARVAPGVSDLRRSRLAAIEGGRTAAVGNLRENLQRRRVLGSSFAQDAITRANAEFAAEAERVEAESFLTELELTTQLRQQEFEARRSEYQTYLDELNLQAEVATQLSTSATAQLGANARLKAQLDADSASGLGSLLGTIAGPIAGLATGSILPATMGLY